MAWSERDYQQYIAQQDQDEPARAKRERKQAAGRQARKAGDGLECLIDEINDTYVAGNMLARWLRQQPRMRATWRGAELVFKPIEKAPCDYVLIFPSGLFAIFDAKSTIHNQQFTWPAAQEHQLDELRVVHERTGGLSPAFALVEWQASLRVHPIWTIEDRTVRRAEGLAVEGHDYLATVRGVWPHCK